MNRLKNICSGAVFAFLGSTVAAQAITCAGVEWRVNNRTQSVESAIASLISARTSSLVAQEVLERQRLLSAMSVMTKQLAQSSQQEIVANQSASKALAQSIVEQSTSDQIRAAVREYGNTGHNACGLVQRGYTVSAAVQDSGGNRSAITDAIAERHAIRSRADYEARVPEWFALTERSDLTAETLFNGDDEAARDYISLVMGPPRAPLAEGGTAGSVDRATALRDIARQSVTAYVMAEVAATQRVETALRDMSREWVGDDGGAAWAARQAASGPRAELLDTARIEAANIALTANSVKRDLLEELALASFALSYADGSMQEAN